MKLASKVAASELIVTPIPLARLLIQLSSVAPLGSILWMTLPCICAALSKGLLASSCSSTSTTRTVDSGNKGAYSARAFSKPTRPDALDFQPFLLFFLRDDCLPGKVFAPSPRRPLGRPSTTTSRCSARKGSVLHVVVMVARSTSAPL